MEIPHKQWKNLGKSWENLYKQWEHMGKSWWEIPARNGGL